MDSGEDGHCLQYKDMVNIWDNEYANYPDLIISIEYKYWIIIVYPINMYNHCASIDNTKSKEDKAEKDSSSI